MPGTILLSFRKCRHILREAILRYKKLQKNLSQTHLKELETTIEALDAAINQKDQNLASAKAEELLTFLKTTGKKSSLEHIKEFLFAICLAVVVAAFVRYVWFELYEIPTGSMRPTFREHDRVLVSKNSFGVNTPFQTSHLEFNEHLLQRGNIIVFSGDGIDLPDVDTTYFLLFPGKKRYVKRCMGKGGDTVYFYGGRLYGIDQEGNELTDMLTDSTFSHIEHIPFITMEGNKTYQKQIGNTDESEIVIMHMNMPCARIIMGAHDSIHSEFFNGKDWIQQEAQSLSYANLWGMKNFAQARLIEPKDLPYMAKNEGYEDKNAKLYLEIRHTPTLPTDAAAFYEQNRQGHPSVLQTRLTWIGLNDEHLLALREALYTSRFVVHNGKAYRYSQGEDSIRGQGLTLASDIPDGTYEFYNGKAYKIGWGDVATLLDKTHPLYPQNERLLKALFNSGIELSENTNPQAGSSFLQKKPRIAYFPARYAYFQDGALCVMGLPIFKAGDAKLSDFEKLEANRARKINSYIAFQDQKAPLLADGHFDKEFIKKYGLKIPPKHYLALGDNHSMSLDSRYFGFVPENNIQGSPLLIFWPPGARFGRPPQPEIPFFRIQNAYVLGAALLLGLVSYYYFRRSASMKAFKHLKQQ